ncbi:hypothetical protein F5888DRAFT_1680424 [Russula emetica]|nr:hypothetical protein F5888DRAFT_1680424 [Russula emetica]
MVLAVLNSDPSLCHSESFSAEKFFVAPQKPTRRSRAHNIPGGIKHLLGDPKRRRRISVRSTALPFSSTTQPSSHRSHPRLTRLQHKAANPVTQKTLSAPATPASEGQNPQSPSLPQSHVSIPIDVTFPRRLPELPRKQISPEVLASLGYTPEVPSQYIRDQMERLGPIMYQALRSTKATVSGSTLPETVVINLDGQTSTSMPPTHMAAIYSSAPSGPEPRRVMMYPIHQSILSLYCANLPVLAASTPPPTNSESPFEAPVVPLALPNPDSFPFLTQFMYLKDAHTLFESFLSLTPSKGIPSDLDQPARYDAFMAEYSTILAQNYTMQRLANQAAKVHGLWRNACALGISDIDLEAFFDLAWEILMKALTLSSNSSPVAVST